MTIERFIYVKDGLIENPFAVTKQIADLPDGRYLLKIEPKNKRSLNQNDWFHAILPDVQKALYNLGWYEVNTPAKAKLFLKSLFFRKEITNGEIRQEIIEDTSDTSKEDFNERAEQIIAWAQEYLGIDIAPPGKQTTLYKEQ